MTEPASRREWLKRSVVIAGAAALPGSFVTACQQEAARPIADDKNLFEILKKSRFMGQDGEEVNVEGLRQKLKHQYITLTFGYNGCSQLCTLMNPMLGLLGEAHPDRVTTLAINVNPRLEGLNAELRQGYLNYLHQTGIRHRGVEVLYPLDAAKIGQGPLSAALSDAEAPRIAINLNVIANKARALDHTAYAFLFAPGGAELDRKLVNQLTPEVIADWGGKIARAQER